MSSTDPAISSEQWSAFLENLSVGRSKDHLNRFGLNANE